MKRALTLAFALACSRPSAPSGDARAAASVVDDATVPSCTVTYSCGLSHPGLGSSSRTTAIDFATCTRTTANESGPFETPSARTSTKTSAQLSTADCKRVRATLTAVTQDDAAAAQESAHIDSEACGLTLQCKGDAAPRLNVQRQTTSGKSRVEALIRAVLGMAP